MSDPGHPRPEADIGHEYRVRHINDLLAELRAQATGEAPTDAEHSEDTFSALALVLVDCGGALDHRALVTAERGLQAVYAAHVRSRDDTPTAAVHCGRVLGFIDMVHWSLRRPSGPSQSGQRAA